MNRGQPGQGDIHALKVCGPTEPAPHISRLPGLEARATQHDIPAASGLAQVSQPYPLFLCGANRGSSDSQQEAPASGRQQGLRPAHPASTDSAADGSGCLEQTQCQEELDGSGLKPQLCHLQPGGLGKMGLSLQASVFPSVTWVQQFLLPAIAVGTKSKGLQATMLDEE